MAGFLSALPIPLGVGVYSPVVATVTAGGRWVDWTPRRPEYREDPEYDEPRPKKKRKKKKRPDPEPVVLAPDPIIERGIVEIRPAWDVMIELQQMQQEAEIARRERLWALALADDDWLMLI